VTDRQTDGQVAPTITAVCIASNADKKLRSMRVQTGTLSSILALKVRVKVKFFSSLVKPTIAHYYVKFQQNSTSRVQRTCNFLIHKERQQLSTVLYQVLSNKYQYQYQYQWSKYQYRYQYLTFKYQYQYQYQYITFKYQYQYKYCA